MSFRWPFFGTGKPGTKAPKVPMVPDGGETSPHAEGLNFGAANGWKSQVMRPHPVLSIIPPKILERLLNESAFTEFPKGHVVFRQGSPCEAIFLIVSGRCEARAVGGLVERIFGSGDTMGERAFLNREPYRFTAVVATDCVVLRISTVELQTLFDDDPFFAGRFSQALTKRFMAGGDPPLSRRVQRIVSLLSFTDWIDDRALVMRLAEELQELTGQRVLMVHFGPGEEVVRLEELPGLAGQLNGAFAFREHVNSVRPGVHELRVGAGPNAPGPAAVPLLLSHCGRHYDYVILHLAAAAPMVPALECLIQSDLAYVLVGPGAQAADDFGLLMRELAGQARETSGHVQPIMVVDENLPRVEYREAIAKLGVPVHSFGHGFPGKGSPGDHRFHLHVRRLAREIARCRIGLALSCGGAKGLAHIGVIQVLEKNGIEVDCVAGSSMGAYVGGLWANGADGAQIEKIARMIEGRWGLWSLFDPVLPPRRGFLKTGRVMQQLRRSLGDTWFCELIRPLRVTATHLETLERVVFASGDVGSAIEASIAIPGIVVPVTIDGETHIDGGIADPLPVDVLQEMGIERIIAVNVIPPPERLREWREQRCSPADRRAGSPSLGAHLNRHFNYFAKGNVLDILLQAISGAQTRVAETSGLSADILLRPLSCGAQWHDFTNPGKYIALGRQVAEAQLPGLLALAKKGPHENKSMPAIALVA